MTIYWTRITSLADPKSKRLHKIDRNKTENGKDRNNVTKTDFPEEKKSVHSWSYYLDSCQSYS